MFSDALIIMAREFRNLFKSRRTLLMTFGLPLFLFPVIFTGLGLVEKNEDSRREEGFYYVEFRNMNDDRFRDLLALRISFIESDQGIGDESLVISRQGGDVEILYDSSSRKMEYAAEQAGKALEAYNDLLADKRLEEAGLSREDLRIIRYSLVDKAAREAREGAVLAVFIPYILILFLLVGAMSLVLDVTAGEKERGTISILLVNQISRTSIALGKTFYVIICSILNSFSSVLGMALGLYLLIRNTGGSALPGLTLFTPGRIIQLFFVLVSVSAVVSSIMVYLGSLARNLKEGGSYVMPVYMLGLVAVIITMNMDAASRMVYYALPVVNGVFVMKSLLTGLFPLAEYALCLSCNLALTALFVYLTSRLYNSERILKTL